MSMIISRKYEELGQLGQGGMGVVYKVRHTTLDTVFALKVLPRDLMDNPDMLARFYREARVVARLSHPNIVRVSDIDHDDTLNFHYFVMEYIQGQTFAHYLRERGPLPLQDIVNIARQVASALAYAHEYSPPVIHRDIKPANIMIEDRTGRVVVMDFGIAKELDNTEVTKSGMVIGTLKYCAPEQMRHEPLDGRADIYSLGMVMYEAYAGRQFFAGLDEAAVIGKALYDAQEHDPEFPRQAPPTFVALVKKAIAKSRDQRQRNVEELLRDLEACDVKVDATERIVLPSSATYVSSAEKTKDDVKELEEQIRKLEEERQKRLVLSAQAQAQEARERAAQAGSGRWALDIFQNGLSREETGRAHLRDQQYPQAQEAYQEAERLFSQAYDQASAAAVFHKAEQTRQEMATVKSEAERYGAREKARTFYGRGLSLQARADDLWEHETYQEAEQAYAEARSIFADARDLAYRETFREEAITAQVEARAARAAAEQEGAEELAAEGFQLANRSEQQAAAALQSDEFFQARELYVASQQQYALAQRQAHAERQRQHAPTAAQARRQMETVRGEVENQGEQKQFAPLLAQGRQFAEQGQKSEEQGEYIEAISFYEQARQEYERVREDIEQTRRRLREQVVEARAQALAAKEKAEGVNAAQCAQTVLEEANKNEEQANAALAQGDFTQARELYLSTVRNFVLAEQHARVEQQRLQDRAAKIHTPDVQTRAESALVEKSKDPVLPSAKARAAENRKAFPRVSFLHWILAGAGVVVVVGGFYLFGGSRSSTPGPTVSAQSVPAQEPAPQSQPTPLAESVTESSAPVKQSAVAPSATEKEKFTNVVRITKYTNIPTVNIQTPPADVARVFLDEQEIPRPPDGGFQAALGNLPVGESAHTLRLVGESPERSQEIPVVVRYYPRWELRQFVDERDEAYAVAFSPDGSSVASSSKDKVVKLWNSETGEKLHTFTGHDDWVTGVAFSPDGRTILSCSDDKTLRLWEVATGKRLRTFSGHGDFVNGVAFSPDGKMAVSGSKDNSLKLWNVQTGQAVRTLTGHRGWVLAVAFSPDGKSVLSGSNDKTVKLWDVKTGQVVRTFSGHQDVVFGVAFSPDGKTLASGSHDKTVRVWEVKTGQNLHTFSGHEDWVNGVAVSPDGRFIASGSKDKTVRLWDVETGQLVRMFVGHELTIAGVAFSPDGKTVISASRDKTLRLWWAAIEPTPEVESPLADAPSAAS